MGFSWWAPGVLSSARHKVGLALSSDGRALGSLSLCLSHWHFAHEEHKGGILHRANPMSWSPTTWAQTSSVEQATFSVSSSMG